MKPHHLDGILLERLNKICIVTVPLGMILNLSAYSANKQKKKKINK